MVFDDARSRRVVLVAHCVLNQNAKLGGCARYPGAMREVAELLVRDGVGLVQLPCPELACMGLDRGAGRRRASVAAEDTRIARRLSEERPRWILRDLVEAAVRQVEDYRAHGFEVVGFVGIDGSPSCGVETSWTDRASPGPGVFTAMLQAALKDAGVPMVGVRAGAPQEAVEKVQGLLAPARAAGAAAAPRRTPSARTARRARRPT
jgi:predicted secreted protein